MISCVRRRQILQTLLGLGDVRVDKMQTFSKSVKEDSNYRYCYKAAIDMRKKELKTNQLQHCSAFEQTPCEPFGPYRFQHFRHRFRPFF